MRFGSGKRVITEVNNLFGTRFVNPNNYIQESEVFGVDRTVLFKSIAY